jgi:hypothetical protein
MTNEDYDIDLEWNHSIGEDDATMLGLKEKIKTDETGNINESKLGLQQCLSQDK